MFIRRKANRGGSFSIMLVMGERQPGKKHSSLRVIKNFGCASEKEELDLLIAEAQAYKAHLLQVSPKVKVLKITSEQDIKSCHSFNVGFKDVYGHFFQNIFKSINLKSSDFRKLHDLIVMRIAFPASKRKTSIKSNEYGFTCQLDSIYKLMDQLTEKIILQSKHIIHQHTQQLLLAQNESVDVMFYDLTTVYFETNSQDVLRDFGFSKDGKHQHVQIMLAVIVTKQGLPIDYEEFPGNCYEGHTLLPVIDKIKSRYQINKIVLVADAALMNKINLIALTENNIHYVIAAKIKNMKKNIKQEILDINHYKKTVSYINENKIIEDEIKSKIISMPDGSHLIAFHSTKRARKDEYDRQKDIDKIKKYLGSTTKNKLTSRLKKPYIKISKACKIEIDLEKLNQEKQYDGFFGLQTNLNEFHPKELLSTYRGLWQVEQTFRIAKSNLEIRPVYHYNIGRIKAHFLICYISLALIRYVEFTLEKNGLHYPCEQIHHLLAQIRITEIKHADNMSYQLLEDPPEQVSGIYRALNLPWYKKFTYQDKNVVPHYQ